MKPDALKINAGISADKRLIYLLSALTPLLCMLVIYAVFGVFPFGDRTVLVMDLNGQYADFMMYYRRALLGGDSLFYSLTKEMGGNVFGLFSYYLSSPFTLLMLFFPNEVMPEGVAVITILKIAASGLTFSVFLRNVFKNNSISIVLFSCAYALMTYSMHYSMCIMWLDGVIWLPIVLLGIERIMDGKSPLLMLAAYTVTMISNYYTAYMTTLFTVIYFCYRYAVREGEKSAKDFFKKLLKTAIAGALGVLLSVVLLFPTFMDILQGKLAGGGGYSPNEFLNGGITNIWRRLFIGQYDSITNSGTPNIFCGVLCGLMTGVYFFNPKIKVRAKIAALCVYAVMFVSFFIQKIDIVWHIFQYPSWYPYRYAYAFNFFSVMIAFLGFINMDTAPIKWTAFGVSAYAALMICVRIFADSMLTNKSLAMLTLIAVAVYAAAVLCLRACGGRGRNTVYALLIALTCAELITNGYFTICGLDKEHTYQSRGEYAEDVGVVSSAVDYVKAHDSGLYRMEKTIARTDNDSMSFGYNGMTHYSSTYNSNVVNFNSRMGMLQEYILIRYLGSTVITDSILGVKYIVSDYNVNDAYEPVTETADYTVYENPYALPLGFAANASAIKSPSYVSDYMENQNLFVSSLLGVSPAKNAASSTDGAAEFTVGSDASYYIEVNEKYDGDINLTVNGEKTSCEYGNRGKKIFYIGDYKSGDNIRAELENNLSMNVYSVDTDILGRSCAEKRGESGFNVTRYTNTEIEGTCTLGEDEILFTTIPYEKGWSAYVDGEKVPAQCAQGVFLAVDAGEGEHSVTLRYKVPGFAGAAAVSVPAVFLAVLFIAVCSKKPDDKNMKKL